MHITVLAYSYFFFFFSSRRRHTRSLCDWSSDVCSSDLATRCKFALTDRKIMPISESDIEKIAQLAHLEITDEERRVFAPQMAEIVAYVDQLNEIDTSAIEPALGGLTREG